MNITEKSEGILCLIGADSHAELIAEIEKILFFIEKSTGISLIDVVFTATRQSQNKACIAGIWVNSLDELRVKMKMALQRISSTRQHLRMREKSGIYFTRNPIYSAGGKIAFIYPGTGSFHLEMMRDLALTFDGVREKFDDMEEAFSGFCNVASPSEWLFATTPEHSLSTGGDDDTDQSFFMLLAAASTYLASLVFTNLLLNVGIKPQASAGIGLGAFTSYYASQHDPTMKLVQILRDAGKMLLRLTTIPNKPLIQLTVDKILTSEIEKLCELDPENYVIVETLAHDECVICVSPEKQSEAEAFIKAGGGNSVAEPLPSPFNTGKGGSKMLQILEPFFKRWIKNSSDIPLYSCVTSEPSKNTPDALADDLIEQMISPVNLFKLINKMYDDGHRIFVEVGARGLLSPIIEKILKDKPEPTLVVPMHILHRAGSIQVGQALGLLATNGVPMDYSGFRFFRRAKWLDFNKPVLDSGSESMQIALTRELPALRADLLDPRILVTEDLPLTQNTENRSNDTIMPTGNDFPLLRSAEIIFEEPGKNLTLKTLIRLEDFPYMNDYAIGTSQVSLNNPQVRGLTLFSVSSSLEIMAEAARKLYPGLRVIRIEHLIAQRWVSFEFGKIALQIQVDSVASPEDDTQTVRVQLRNDSPNTNFTWPLLEAHIVLGTILPEIPQFDIQNLLNPRLVNWSAQEIYPARLFQGPLLRNIRNVSSWSMNGIDYEIRMPSRSHTIRNLPQPIFSVMPILLDAIVSGFSLWRSHERFHGAISLPFRCRSIRYYVGWVREGTKLKASLRLVNVTPRSHQVDIYVTDSTGKLLMLVKGWEEVSGRAARELHDFVMNPSKNFITKPLPESMLPDNVQGVSGAMYENTSPEFFVLNQELWMKALACSVLTPNEREDFAEMGGAPMRKLEWLHGRITAKESVRRYLLENYNNYAASADVDIWKDHLGKPHPLGAWQSQINAQIDLSIAHTPSFIVAAVIANGKIGLDVERVGRDLTEEFLRGVFTLEEQELTTKSGYGPTAVLRFWCAKEAISKALGTGIRFAPTDLRIRKSNPADGMLHIELLGQWAEQFVFFKGVQIPVKTSIMANHVFACCILPQFPELN